MSKIKFPKVLIVEDDNRIVHQLINFFDASQWRYSIANSGSACKAKLQKENPHVILMDYSLPDVKGVELIAFCKENKPDLPILLYTGHDQGAVGFEASRAGADDFITKGDDIKLLFSKLDYLISLNIPKAKSVQKSPAPITVDSIIGESKEANELRKRIMRYAHSNSNVMILGPNGSGKELVAASLHAHSRRATQPFIIDNASTGGEQLIDSKYFGHRKGAFTGADTDHEGLFQAANGGTLFIDEIADMPEFAQAKLLRVLQTGDFTQMNSTKAIKVDVRVITATNKDLKAEVKAGRFRLDLLHRLNTNIIKVPSLNERIEDVLLLANHFIPIVCMEEEVPTKQLSAAAEALLCRTDWEGNIRELHSVLRNAVINALDEPVLEEEHFERLHINY
jgi:two-component system, NtrC family, nitrogen regulation response regulator NtrX